MSRSSTSGPAAACGVSTPHEHGEIHGATSADVRPPRRGARRSRRGSRWSRPATATAARPGPVRSANQRSPSRSPATTGHRTTRNSSTSRSPVRAGANDGQPWASTMPLPISSFKVAISSASGPPRTRLRPVSTFDGRGQHDPGDVVHRGGEGRARRPPVSRHLLVLLRGWVSHDADGGVPTVRTTLSMSVLPCCHAGQIPARLRVRHASWAPGDHQQQSGQRSV